MTQSFRKSWPTFLMPVLGIGISIYVFKNAQDWMGWLIGPPLSFKFSLFLKIWATVIMVTLAYRIVLLLSYKVSISATGIHAQYGVMPWSKFEKTWEPDQIYSVECSVPKLAPIHWALGHGHLIIRGKEGTTEGTRFTYIARVKRAAALGNDVRHRTYI